MIKLELDNRNISEKSLNIWKLDRSLLHNPQLKEEVSRKLENI